MDLEKINKQIKKKEAEYKQITEKIASEQEKQKKIKEELDNLNNLKASYELRELKCSLTSKGLKLDDILEAINKGDITIIEEKMLEYQKNKLENN